MSRAALARYLGLFIAWVGLAACATHPLVSRGEQGGMRGHALYVVNHGWHTGLVLPTRDLWPRLPPELARRFPGVPYLEFGWGDEAFYQADRASAGLALRALLWPTASVMHVVAVPERPEHYFASRPKEKICLSRQQYLALADFISASFFLNDAQEILPQGGGLYGDSQFYRAKGKYHLLNTCNTWIARGLRSMGMPGVPTFMVTAQSIMDYLKEQKERELSVNDRDSVAC